MRRSFTLRAAVTTALLSSLFSVAAAKPDYHLGSTPETVVWGYWAAETKPALKVKSGQTVEIDTVSMGGMPDDKPEQFFIDNGISLDLQVVKNLIALKKAFIRNQKGLQATMVPGRPSLEEPTQVFDY